MLVSILDHISMSSENNIENARVAVKMSARKPTLHFTLGSLSC